MDTPKMNLHILKQIYFHICPSDKDMGPHVALIEKSYSCHSFFSQNNATLIINDNDIFSAHMRCHFEYTV